MYKFNFIRHIRERLNCYNIVNFQVKNCSTMNYQYIYIIFMIGIMFCLIKGWVIFNNNTYQYIFFYKNLILFHEIILNKCLFIKIKEYLWHINFTKKNYFLYLFILINFNGILKLLCYIFSLIDFNS